MNGFLWQNGSSCSSFSQLTFSSHSCRPISPHDQNSSWHTFCYRIWHGHCPQHSHLIHNWCRVSYLRCPLTPCSSCDLRSCHRLPNQHFPRHLRSAALKIVCIVLIFCVILFVLTVYDVLLFPAAFGASIALSVQSVPAILIVLFEMSLQLE